jgi:hypothetical protein
MRGQSQSTLGFLSIDASRAKLRTIAATPFVENRDAEPTPAPSLPLINDEAVDGITEQNTP